MVAGGRDNGVARVMEALLVLAAWVALWGTLGSLVAPRKGYPPSWGFMVAGVFALLGVAYIALKPDMTAEERERQDHVGERR